MSSESDTRSAALVDTIASMRASAVEELLNQQAKLAAVVSVHERTMIEAKQFQAALVTKLASLELAAQMSERVFRDELREAARRALNSLFALRKVRS